MESKRFNYPNDNQIRWKQPDKHKFDDFDFEDLKHEKHTKKNRFKYKDLYEQIRG